MNEAYLDLSGLKREDFGGDPHRWSSTVIPEDREYVEEQWEKLVQGIDIRPFEFRVRRPWHLPGSTDEKDRMEHSWVLANAFLKYDEAGNSQRILAWLTDISHQKWSQQLQAQRLEDVLETKRQSENFIDMVSPSEAVAIIKRYLTQARMKYINLFYYIYCPLASFQIGYC